MEPVPAPPPVKVKRQSPLPRAAFRTVEPPAFHLIEDDINSIERPRPEEYIPEPPLSILDPVPRAENPERARLMALPLAMLFVVLIVIVSVVNTRPTWRTAPPPVDLQQTPAPVRSYEVGDGVSAPIPVTRIEPQYSQEALDARIEGTVQLYVRVAPNGTANVLGVLRSLDPKLDRNATEAVGQWRFHPGVKNGVPVFVLTKVDITFRLP
jgi:TonB family protein